MVTKNIIILLLFIGIIASMIMSPVSAETFKARCNGGSVDHQATWTKIFDQKVCMGEIVKKNGEYYKVYRNLYKFTKHACFHESHDKTYWPDGHTYESLSVADPRGSKYDKYSYVKVKKGERTVNIKPTDENSECYSDSYTHILKITTTNFIVTHTTKFANKMVNVDSPFTGYVTVKSINPQIKIKTIKILQGNGYKGFKWKTHKINTNKKTIKLGKNILANFYENGKGWKRAFIVNY